MAPAIPPAIEATESLSPPMLVANRIAARAEPVMVARARASGTIVNVWVGKHVVASSAGSSSGCALSSRRTRISASAKLPAGWADPSVPAMTTACCAEADDLRRRHTFDCRRNCGGGRGGSGEGVGPCVCGDRRLPGCGDEFFKPVRSIHNTDRGDSDCGPASVMTSPNPSRISGAVELPQRLDTRVHALAALEKLPTNTRVSNLSVLNDRASDGQGPFGVVSRFAEEPSVPLVAAVARNRFARCSVEAVQAVRIPT